MISLLGVPYVEDKHHKAAEASEHGPWEPDPSGESEAVRSLALGCGWLAGKEIRA